MFIIHTSNEQLAKQINYKITGKLIYKNTHYCIINNSTINLSPLRNEFQVDINYLPDNFNFKQFKFFVSDMDSTLINIECIDEIADFANLKPQVAKITSSAMRGEIDFNTSLKQRVKLLKGIDKNILLKVYEQRLKINYGGEDLINFLQSQNIKTAVVSGGFTFFTQKLKTSLALDYQMANELEFDSQNKLTGNTVGKIIDAMAKADFVKNLECDNLEVITCGDGANDLEMMRISGLSIAYHAKDIVNKEADIVIKFGGLDKIIDLLV